MEEFVINEATSRRRGKAWGIKRVTPRRPPAIPLPPPLPSPPVSTNSRLMSNFGPRSTAYLEASARVRRHVPCASNDSKDSNRCDFRDVKPQRYTGDPHQSHARLLTRHCTPSYASSHAFAPFPGWSPIHKVTHVSTDCRYFECAPCTRVIFISIQKEKLDPRVYRTACSSYLAILSRFIPGEFMP